MLEMRNINKTFGAVQALAKASFNINKGEIVAFLGANGSGKSTLIKILGGCVRADSGEIEINGKKTRMVSSTVSRKHKIAVAYQELSLLPRMTVYENVMLGHFIKGKFGQADETANKAFVRNLFDIYNIQCSLDDYPSDLPTSTLSLIEVVKAVSWEPDLLLLDEVTATLHYDEVELLFKNLKELAKTGVAIAFVTHRLAEVYRIASRAIVLRNGESVADVPLPDTAMDSLVMYMTGKKPEIYHTQSGLRYAGENALLTVEDMSVGSLVKSISLTVQKGELIGLGGLEGQGQSQFLRALYGAIPHETGTMTIDGKTVRYNSAAEAVRNGIGFISGDRNRESIFSQRSIGENIYSAKLAQRSVFNYVSKNLIKKETQKIVDDYNIKIAGIHHPVSSLSGGNQQKVVFGRWVYIAPRLLLLDDPTKGVDVTSRLDFHKFLNEATRSGMTVIIVSSDNDELLTISDRIYVFFEGRIHAVLEGENKTEERLVSAMLGLVEKKEERQ